MSEPVKLYLDEDTINRALIKALRSRNIDLLTVQETNRLQVSDREHLDYATSLNRTVSRLILEILSNCIQNT